VSWRLNVRLTSTSPGIERSTTGVQIDMEYPEQSQSEDQVIAEVKRLTKFLGDRYVVEKHFAGVAHRAQ
jgi:hypothetical protein